MSHELVLDLLTYIEQVEKLKRKPAFSVPKDFLRRFQHELKGLPELQFNLQVEGDDVWLRVPRMQEIPAPEPDEALKGWIILPKSPEKSPELKTEAVQYEGKREVGREKIEDHPEIRELFAWYVENQWNPWAYAERPRRKTIAFYNDLFSLQQAIASEGADTPLELVWGIGNVAWKKEGFATPVEYPLLVQACEVLLNEKTFDLEVRPRDVEPRLEADCYAEMELPGVRQLETYWRSALASGVNRLNPFESSTYEGTLKAAVTHLDSTGAYEARTDDVTPPTPSEHLKVTNTWVLFGRKRSGDIFLEDIRRLKKSVEEASSLPEVIKSFVERGDATVRVHAEQPFRGLASSESVEGAKDLFFPMPYNDEQVSIVQKLYTNDGVVVQGPPGTGKSHTIANVICHYLAEGKRVLVTAKSESALSVLQEKLPDAVRPLSVSLLSDERDGMRQFEHAIQTIAASVARLNPARAEAGIAAAEDKLNQLHAKISNLDRNVAVYASKHMRNYSFQGREVTPEEMAKLVLQQADAHEWFDDEPPESNDGSLPFDDEAVASLRRSRMAVREDLVYLMHSLPSPEQFPDWADLLALHRDLAKARSIDARVTEGAIYPLADTRMETFEKTQELAKFLEERTALKAKISATGLPWLDALGRRFADIQPNDPVLQALLAAAVEIRRLEAQRKEFVAKAVEVPIDAESNEDFAEAVNRMIAGKSAFAFPFGKGEARKMVAAAKVAGAAPDSPDEWRLVQEATSWRIDARRVIAKWNSFSLEFGLGQPEPGLDAGFRQLAQWQPSIEAMRQLAFEYNANLHKRLSEVFGSAAVDRMGVEGEQSLADAYTSARAHVDKGRLGYALRRQQELVGYLEGCGGEIVGLLRSFLLEFVGDKDADESELQAKWLELSAELRRLTALRPYFDEIKRVTAAIEAAGAPKWAKRLQTIPATAELDAVTPATWREAWNWRLAVLFLDRIDGHKRLRELFEERRTLTTALARTYQDLVAEKTWLGVHRNSPNAVRQALQAYLNAVQAMGAGTGVRAVRHRKTAREAMTRAYQAVPCWVLPHWRVSETLPAEIGLFDLVVIDEASQSDIWALPALLRGKKLLVVGDHKQVSPSAVGTAEEKIKELISRFLGNQPFGSEMTPDKSIYDLARVIFAGNQIMLKEHFRCVPAIIEFSNRVFYQGDIRPLRVPKANERLDPPLIDVFVKGGYRKGDVNPAEAKAIVDEIKSIIEDPAYEGRSIGVVTLLGNAQAAHIHELVSEEISPVDIVGRKIAIGPPPVFQGRERDIMLVSMVSAPGDRAVANRADMHQRFNVALSRARDRMYLFRSLSGTEVSADTLTGKVIGHFKQPFQQDVRRVQALRERCESGFELEMFDELVKRGFRVEPQVPCGGYRIDFVVEGNEGRRLAIECDGDRFHGPGQWQDDMTRQRVLERAGWTFWRCFASSFVRRRQAVLDDLMGTLADLGIEPLGAESVDNTVWVSYKEVDPFGVENQEQEEEGVM